ncbi:hypothetical protein H1C71_032409, partial [Ictidomys tridecemlineatus]
PAQTDTLLLWPPCPLRSTHSAPRTPLPPATFPNTPSSPWPAPGQKEELGFRMPSSLLGEVTINKQTATKESTGPGWTFSQLAPRQVAWLRISREVEVRALHRLKGSSGVPAPWPEDGNQVSRPPSRHGRKARDEDQSSSGLGSGLSENQHSVEAPRSWKVLSGYTTFLPVPSCSAKVSLIIFWGLGCRRVIVFGNGSGYKDRNKGYFKSSGQEVMVRVCVCVCPRACNYTPRLEMTGKGPPAPGNKRIGAEDGRKGQERNAQVCPPKAFGIGRTRSLKGWWGREG